ncbi:MAG: hypothetical protein M0R80_13760 [Proteobacteria bacterium]|jgi:putative heme iron utilization protein|nr:hypothetical protein [Pseudomonadota bacterium]
MAKIIHFPPTLADTPLAFIGECQGVIKENDIKSILIAYKLDDGSVMTGYFECDFGTRQELAGHIQCDIIDQMILANPDRY